MEFRILGPLEVVDGDRILRLGSGKQLALVALLLLRANEAVSVDRLVDELWGESPPPTAAKIVRNYVSLLRRELGERLETRPPGYLLRVEEGELDSRRLERAVESGELAELNDAVALWRGAPLAQFTYERFAEAEIARLEELRLTALEARFDAQLALGRHAAVIPELEALAQQHPLREQLAGQLLLALYRAGRQADALEAYRRTRRNLDEQLGIEPGPALRELERKILTQDESLGAPPPAPDDVLSTRRRRSLALLVAAALLAAAALTAFLVTRDTDRGLSEVQPNYVGVIDSETNTIEAAVPVGIRPGPVALGEGSVWVANLQDRTLTRVDPERRAHAETITLRVGTPTGLAVGAGAVWVAHGALGQLSRIDLQFAQNQETVDVTAPPYNTPFGSVTLFDGAVWVAFGDSTLARIVVPSLRVSGRSLAGSSPTGLAGGAGAIWVANSGDATVDRFAPATFEEGPLRSVSVGRRPSAVAYGEGAVWVANLEEDTVTRIDPATHSTFTIEVDDEPAAIAVGAGAVWVASTGAGTVSRIDPGSRKVVRTIETGNAPAGIAAGDRYVWVTVQAP